MNKLLLFLLYVITEGSLLAQNYEIGDTLSVVAFNGLNLREEPGKDRRKITLLEIGEKVIVVKKDEILLDSVFGFYGNWIKVHSLKDNEEGFVFDAFVSRYPVLKEFKTLNKIKPISSESVDVYQFMPEFLEEYALRSFTKVSCELEYFNGSDDSYAHKMILSKLNTGDLLIKHYYSESGSMELELQNPRISEVYYLVLNLLNMLPNEIYKIDDNALRNPKYEQSIEYNCVAEAGTQCIVKTIRKDKNTISIFFYWGY